ncbi:L-2-hydroxyglutarate oxidase LhgO [Symmachiella macrocystis]|uniref:L-2-hydroxyglutarate oxidase LhgO n=1 Tax=Symmachiella macrocystis TaxID=2527985 RepID=A0A5C6BM29_9PLAN|nr:L-2-hydroxyglutarate oxidase [Symmachiella macrocystis]TWU12346.1 L-2-hydroxyglutarate oxidase LhgO [Symmachiella macrocystis]
MQQTDVAIIGGGIVGLATAHRLGEQFPDLKITVLEKEPAVAEHQTGHNSGVLHTGIYYKPGSLKATNCRAGKLAMQSFCETQGIDYDICGKVIVALDESELPALERIYERGQANGVNCEIIGRERLHELEPHAAGVQAIHVPEAGIVNYRQVCRRLAEIIVERGGCVQTDARVTSITPGGQRVVVASTAGEWEAQYLVNCAGLQCDRVAKLGGQKPSAQIVPFRGEYYELKPEAHHLCKTLIYPVPDPSFPFLGVHFTRMIEGGVECGPNAVLAFAREGYRKTNVNPYDLLESLTYPGFVKLALKYWRVGAGEMWRSCSKAAFVKALQRLVPDIRSEHLVTAPAGVRAQAVSRDGSMVDDFLIDETERVINIGNAPSPAATASLNIGAMITEKLAARF